MVGYRRYRSRPVAWQPFCFSRLLEVKTRQEYYKVDATAGVLWRWKNGVAQQPSRVRMVEAHRTPTGVRFRFTTVAGHKITTPPVIGYTCS